MVFYKDYVAGWMDSSIHAMFEMLPRRTTLRYALITCIDSNSTPHALLDCSPELRSLAKSAQQVGSGLLVPTEVLLESDSSNQIFFGFDEIWFFPRRTITPKPVASWLIGPSRIGQRTLQKLGPWMSANTCLMGLGDGEGLNFVVRTRGAAKYVVAHSIDQERPKPVPAG